MQALHYSGFALLRRCGFILVASLIVATDLLFRANGGFPRVMGFGAVASAAILAAMLYLAVATMVLMLSLARHGAAAVACDDGGIFYHSAWWKRRFTWAELSTIALDVRYTRSSHYFVVALHRAHGVQKCFTIDVRLLVETIDQAGDWADRAERQRVAHGGLPFVAPTGGLSGWVTSRHAQQVAAARQASRT